MAKSMKKFIAVRYVTSPPLHLSLMRLHQREKMNGHDGGHPRCSWGDTSLENVFLNRIVRVSAASWQPEICVELPSVPSQVATSPL